MYLNFEGYKYNLKHVKEMSSYNNNFYIILNDYPYSAPINFHQDNSMVGDVALYIKGEDDEEPDYIFGMICDSKFIPFMRLNSEFCDCVRVE